jgi:hypothetical protein
MASTTLTTLIPCLNEELSIAGVIRECADAFLQVRNPGVGKVSQDQPAAIARVGGTTVITRKGRVKVHLLESYDRA